MDGSKCQNLLVWQKAMDLVVVVYSLTRELPKDELYALVSQMQKAAVSIPSNIAEGHARNSNKEFIQFLSIAQGSKAELETQLLLCVRVGYLADQDITLAIALLLEIGKMLSALIKTLKPATSYQLRATSSK